MSSAKSSEEPINFKQIEQKWQKAWEDKKVFAAKESKENKFYCLEMFPYPSASYLHMGHVRNYAMGDLVARYKRMKGFNVLYPMGFDAFGLPAENAAIKEGIHPKEYTLKAIETIKRLMKELGLSYDWSREIATCYPEYYKWNQWLFLKMYEKGIAYRKKAPVNWCPKDKTVLANEEVIDGKCWRCNSEVTITHLEQWFLKITQYADELLAGLETIDWPQKVKEMQKNWIGKSEGTRVLFKLKDSKEHLEIFTTRPDTIFGVTFIVYAAQHSRVAEFVKGTKYQKEYDAFLKKVSVAQKIEVDKEKEGFFTGKYAIHPFTGEEVPIYASNFVLADYGTGAVMAVPAHDERDFEFAKKYKIPIKLVIQPEDKKLDGKKLTEAYTGAGKLVNSQGFDDLFTEEAKVHVTKDLEFKKMGGAASEYKLRDWLISRQRYWGTPIPIVYCKTCGTVPLPEKELPVVLPDKVEFTGKGNPLLTNKEFIHTHCPKCKKPAERETDTMATFFDSSWYFLRYCDPKNEKQLADPKKMAAWMPVDQYIGGVEHAVLHLLYARFFTKFIRDCGLLKIDEPFTKLFNQGIVHKEGKRMSKSQGNTVTAEEISQKYGIDTARLYLFFVAGPEKDMDWDDNGVEGAFRIINRLLRLLEKKNAAQNHVLEHKLHKALKIIEQGYANFEFNKSAVAAMELINYFSEQTEVPKDSLKMLVKAIAPMMPHIAEEMWSKIGNKDLIVQQPFPTSDEKKIDDNIEQAEKALDKTVSDITNVLAIIKTRGEQEAKKIYIYTIPPEVKKYDESILEKRIGLPVKVYASNDPKKHDPQGKASKAKPGKPGIYVE